MKPAWTRVSAFVVCRDAAGRVLLTRFALPGHPDHGKWTLPGGGMHWGESIEETALRELEEETGYRATLGRISGVFTVWLTPEESLRGEAGLFVGVLFRSVDLSGELREEFDTDNTTDAAQWFTLAEIETLSQVPIVDFALRHEVVDGP